MNRNNWQKYRTITLQINEESLRVICDHERLQG